ncbi:MAG TPA: PIN domain-containing protein [Acidimicrobiales bacterium]|nr:PIN domain-containing protein [Acidimicrobiales bacterium]
MTPAGVAALDANVLVPIVACDFLLTAFDHGLYEPVVSATVLDEVERTLLEDFPHLDPAAIRRRVSHMRAALEDHIVDTAGTELGDAINAKDHHVVAAAIAGEAACLVTEDATLRREVAASGHAIEPLGGDAFALRLWSASPGDVDAVIRDLVAKRRRRPVTPVEMARQLGLHFPSMSAEWIAGQRS